MKLAFFAAMGNTVVAKDIDQVPYSLYYVFDLLYLSTLANVPLFIFSA